MEAKAEPRTRELVSLALGTSRIWDVAIDEVPDRDEWSVGIEGPRVYVSFQLRDLKRVRAALQFLKTRLPSPHAARRDSESDFTLGRFGSASVSLLWDNEDFVRCFLLIGSRGRSTIRITLDEDDVRQLIEALSQTVKELPQSSVD